jgi:hypothetical protein
MARVEIGFQVDLSLVLRAGSSSTYTMNGHAPALDNREPEDAVASFPGPRRKHSTRTMKIYTPIPVNMCQLLESATANLRGLLGAWAYYP